MRSCVRETNLNMLKIRFSMILMKLKKVRDSKERSARRTEGYIDIKGGIV